ncbi:MAG: S-methyl-5-thioribose-1-phosphate isomerase [Spirochaetes bacterium GWC1_27_15]|nr:MAG: S-methyl-5-thioribose-1-phosphate isomerase [Spirochaetes bacterium GWB1_27_13]OHD27437.1 MAG: S-methyl-5-thioribose-1-phosphate isomerase [Spirochaetes bacterium GWC1_27_15]
MLINGRHYRTIWLAEDKKTVEIIDQRFLPFEFIIEKINSSTEMAIAIKDMHLRGAPLIGAAAAYGMYLATLEAINNKNEQHIKNCSILLENTRPTAVNLKWALNRVNAELEKVSSIEEKISTAYKLAELIADEDAETCRMIGVNGVSLIEEIYEKNGRRPVQILTHCNAGSLACVDFGTATSPIYEAAKRKIPIHVWVDETRPRNQGKLTSWELEQNKIPNTVICDNTGGYLMMKGMVDFVIVGTDRVTRNGDVANKIGTYLKALAANDNNIPFYVALPSSTIDFNMESGDMIPIEERTQDEVLTVDGLCKDKIEQVRLFSYYAKAANYGFDITPARLVTGFITEKGICKPQELLNFFD